MPAAARSSSLVLVLVLLLSGVASAAPSLRNSSSLMLMPSPPPDDDYDYAGDDNDNITLVKETLVDIQVSPPEEELDLAGVYMHQASKGIKSLLKDSTHILDPFVDFFRALFAHMPSQQPGQQRPVPSRDRRKLYVI
jgi:hypothetical protein